MRTVRVSASRCSPRTRASSSSVASPVALSPMPTCQESRCPWTSTNRSGSTVPSSSATRTGMRAPALLVLGHEGRGRSVARRAARSAGSRRGSRPTRPGSSGCRPQLVRSGEPQIDVQMPSWIRSPGAMQTTPRGAALLEVGDLARHREALGDDELAGHVARPLRAGEDLVDVLREAGRLVDDRRRLALGPRRAAPCSASSRDSRLPVDASAPPARQADQQLGLVQRVRHAPARRGARVISCDGLALLVRARTRARASRTPRPDAHASSTRTPSTTSRFSLTLSWREQP